MAREAEQRLGAFNLQLVPVDFVPVDFQNLKKPFLEAKSTIILWCAGSSSHRKQVHQGLRRWIQEAPRNLLRLHIGVFWAAKWEVRVNRAKKINEPRQTDQWIQQADGVRLAALWLCGRTAAQMRAGDAVARTWDPEPASLPSH